MTESTDDEEEVEAKVKTLVGENIKMIFGPREKEEREMNVNIVTKTRLISGDAKERERLQNLIFIIFPIV